MPLPLRTFAQRALATLLQCPSFAAYSLAHQLTVIVTTKVFSAIVGRPGGHRAVATDHLELQLAPTATAWLTLPACGVHTDRLELHVVAKTNWSPVMPIAVRTSLYQQYALGAINRTRRFTFWLRDQQAATDEGQEDVRCMRQAGAQSDGNGCAVL